MTGPVSGKGGKQLLKVLSMFINIILCGDTPDFIKPFFFFSASLIAVSKRGGSTQPIAVGCTL